MAARFIEAGRVQPSCGSGDARFCSFSARKEKTAVDPAAPASWFDEGENPKGSGERPATSSRTTAAGLGHASAAKSICIVLVDL